MVSHPGTGLAAGRPIARVSPKRPANEGERAVHDMKRRPQAVVLMTILFTLSIGLIDQPRKIAAGVLAGSTGFPSSSVRSADLLAQYVVVLKDGVDSSAVASVHALIYGA